MINFGHGVRLGTLENFDHSGLMRAWRNDYRIYRWCRQNDLLTQESHNFWFLKQAQDPCTRMYSVMSMKDGFVGVCGLTSIDTHNRRAEFSLYIGPEYHRKGYGKQALKTLISHGMNNLGLHSIWGESFEGNPAIVMFKSLGFKMEGIKREAYFKEGRFIDAHLFSILSSDWVDIKGQEWY